MLKPFADQIWTCQTDLKVFGVELGTRMTIVDLDGNGNLLIHSPVKLSSNLKNEINAIGTVRYVVAPNKWHHLFIGDFKSAYPRAMFYCSPGLEIKRPDFKFDAIIGNSQTYPWNPFLEHRLVDGVPIYNEVVFFHPKTKTLILTDLAVHICESNSFFTRFVLKALGSYGKFGWAKLEKLLYVRNKSAFKASLEKILLWDIERILVTHGEAITSNGKQHLKGLF